MVQWMVGHQVYSTVLTVDSCDISKDTRNWHIGMKKIWRDHVNPEIFNKDSVSAEIRRISRHGPMWTVHDRAGPYQDEEQSRPIQELGRQIQARIADAVAWRPVAVAFWVNSRWCLEMR